MSDDHRFAAHLAEDLSPEDFRHVLGLLRDDLVKLTGHLEAAAAAGDEAVFRKVAHGIAGSASTAGPYELEQAARSAMTRPSDVPPLIAMAADIRHMVDAVLVRIEDTLREDGADA